MAGLNVPNLQGLISTVGQGGSTGHHAAMRAQDKYNLDVSQAVAPLLRPLVWNPLTPINGWVAYNTTFTQPAFLRDAAGRIWLKGNLRDGSLNANMFSQALPIPSEQWLWANYTAAGVLGALTLLTNGNVQLTTGATGIVSIDGISYMP